MFPKKFFLHSFARWQREMKEARGGEHRTYKSCGREWDPVWLGSVHKSGVLQASAPANTTKLQKNLGFSVANRICSQQLRLRPRGSWMTLLGTGSSKTPLTPSRTNWTRFEKIFEIPLTNSCRHSLSYLDLAFWFASFQIWLLATFSALSMTSRTIQPT